MQSEPSRVVVLGTGGTIAGTAPSAADATGYMAAQIGIEALVGTIAAPKSPALETEQVAQLDSKDMDHATWLRLAQRVAHHLARADVAGIVITHGTDTLEETAYFLHRVLAPTKPVVLTGAMRPATSMQADGPQNLADALATAATPGAAGVVVAFAGRVHAAADVRKVHSHRLDAFSSGDAGPIACIEAGRLRRFREWPSGTVAIGLAAMPADSSGWPRVEIVTSHAGANGDIVRALCGLGVQGIVVAGTGNGTLHVALEAALLEARSIGVSVLRCTRCIEGPVIDANAAATDGAVPSVTGLTAVAARIELQLQLLSQH